MPQGLGRATKRLHIRPLKKNEFLCSMVSTTPQNIGNQSAHFQENQKEWDKKWDTKKPITFALIKDSKDIPGNSLEKSAVYYAMMIWSMEIPINLTLVKKNKNPDITIVFRA